MSLLIPNEFQTKSPKFAAAIRWGLGLAIAVGVAPFIFLAVKGLIGLGLALATGLILIRATPWFSAATSNFFLKLLKFEARKNPIETMQRLWKQRKEAIDDAEKKIKDFNSAIGLYSQQVDGLKRMYPEEAPRFENHLKAMVELKGRKYVALQNAKVELEKYSKGIERASAIWEMTKASDAISAVAGMLTEKDALNRIQSDEAIKSVEQSMARSIAELDHMINTEISQGVNGSILVTNTETVKTAQFVQEVPKSQPAIEYQPGRALFPDAQIAAPKVGVRR